MLALLSAVTARADIQKASKATKRDPRRQQSPPSAVAGSARVSLDGRVEIVLESHGGDSQEVDFLIRQSPVHGILAGPPRQLTRNTAAVTYVHRAQDGPQTDAFTFAVQVLGGEVSAAEQVVIRVADIAPRLVATPAELDFGAVNAGDTSRAEITLENQGGGVAAGEFTPPAPWEVDGTSSYRLARGERRTLTLVFRPLRSESLAQVVHIPDDGGSIRLIGIGLGGTVPASPDSLSVSTPPAASSATADVAVLEIPRAEPAVTPAAFAAPSIAAAAASSPSLVAAISGPERRASGRPISLAALAGLALAAGGVALMAVRMRARRRASPAHRLPGVFAPVGGVPAKERIKR